MRAIARGALGAVLACLLVLASAAVAGAVTSPGPIKVKLDVYVASISATPQRTRPTAQVKGAACPSARPSRYAFVPNDDTVGTVAPKAGESEYTVTLYLQCGPGKLWLEGAVRVDSTGRITAGWWGVWEASRRYGPYRSCGGALTPGRVGSEGVFSGTPGGGRPLHVRGTLRPYKGYCKPDDQ